MMLVSRLHRFLTKASINHVRFWFILSLTFAVVYGILGLQEAFSCSPRGVCPGYVIQDDARQHVFWMQRFVDSELFPKDLIADYFQAIEPWGTATLYRLMAGVGIEPIFLSKLLPLFLGVITTGYCFGFCMQLFPVPVAGFITTLLLNQNLWMQDTLVSGTSKAFLHPLFLAFLYYGLQRSLLPLCGAIALQGLFYPSFVLISAGVLILQLFNWKDGQIHLSRNRQDYLFCVAGLGVSFLVLLPYALAASEFGPVMSVAQARTLPEFSEVGRTRFFYDRDPWKFWFNASRSGVRFTSALMPPLAYAGLLLPILLRFPSRFPLVKQVKEGIKVFPQILLVSFGLFFAAHAFLFKLYLPSRYTQHTLRLVIVIAAGIALTLLLDAIFQVSEKLTERYFLGKQFLAIGSTLLLTFVLVFYPASLKSFPWTGYIAGSVPSLYQFFQEQPKDSLIASLTAEVDNLPSFSQRSILVGREYGIPYHVGYYRQFRQRTIDLIRAQYSSNLGELQAFIRKYGVDFWLIEQSTFSPDYLNNDWLRQYQPVSAEAQAKLQQGVKPALVSLSDRCSVFSQSGFVVLKAECLMSPEK